MLLLLLALLLLLLAAAAAAEAQQAREGLLRVESTALEGEAVPVAHGGHSYVNVTVTKLLPSGLVDTTATDVLAVGAATVATPPTVLERDTFNHSSGGTLGGAMFARGSLQSGYTATTVAAGPDLANGGGGGGPALALAGFGTGDPTSGTPRGLHGLLLAGGGDAQPERLSFAARTTTTTSGGPDIILAQRGGGYRHVLDLVFRGNGFITLYDSIGPLPSPTLAYAANRWYKIDIVFNWAAATCVIYIDDVLFYNGALATGTASGASDIYIYQFDNPQTSNIADLEFTNVLGAYAPVSGVTVRGGGTPQLNAGVWTGALDIPAAAIGTVNATLRAQVSGGESSGRLADVPFDIVDPCTPGSFSPTLLSPCESCPTGSFTNVSNTVGACEPCATADAPGFSTCPPPPPGTTGLPPPSPPPSSAPAPPSPTTTTGSGEPDSAGDSGGDSSPDGFPLLYIIIAAAAGGCCCILIIIALILVLRRRRGRGSDAFTTSDSNDVSLGPQFQDTSDDDDDSVESSATGNKRDSHYGNLRESLDISANDSPGSRDTGYGPVRIPAGAAPPAPSKPSRAGSHNKPQSSRAAAAAAAVAPTGKAVESSREAAASGKGIMLPPPDASSSRRGTGNASAPVGKPNRPGSKRKGGRGAAAGAAGAAGGAQPLDEQYARFEAKLATLRPKSMMAGAVMGENFSLLGEVSFDMRSSTGDGTYCAIPHALSDLQYRVEEPIQPDDLDLTEAKVLGAGAFGVVFRCKWRDTDVAVKEMRPDSVKPEDVQEFVDEGNLMRNMKPHRNVVRFIGLVLSPVCIVTEFVDGGDMKALVDGRKKAGEGRLDEATEKDVMRQVAAGMAHLAAQGIVHRDLAARNILVSKDCKRAAVADLGMARLVDKSGAIYQSSEFGPLKWMSMEAAQKQKFSEASDVWSWGITYVEVLTLEEPYAGMTAMQSLTEVVMQGQRHPLPEGISAELEQLLMDCWHDSPDQRPTFDAITKHAAMQ